MSRYGTFADLTGPGEVSQLLKKYEGQISKDPILHTQLQEVLQDKYVHLAFKSFLENRGLLLSQASGGKYDPVPLAINVGVEGDPIQVQKTIVHELLHFILDKMDTELAESKDDAGADHFLIAPLEQRFLIIQTLRKGEKLDSLLQDGFSTDGSFGEGLRKSILENDLGAVKKTLSRDPIRGYVYSAMISPLSSNELVRTESREDNYLLSDAQLCELAQLYRRNASLLQSALELAVVQVESENEPIGSVLRSQPFREEFRSFVQKALP